MKTDDVSIIDQIKQAEAKAQEIIVLANASARDNERLAAQEANNLGENKIRQANQDAKQALEQAEVLAKKQAKDHVSTFAQSDEKIVEKATQKIEQTAKYIIERVVS